jgi:Ran GTPase-activating protein (RanGAP) involved in mRNA processing and transport
LIRTQDLANEAHALTGLLRLKTTKLESLHLEGICPHQTEMPEYLAEAIKKHQSITSLKLVNLHSNCTINVILRLKLDQNNLKNLQDLTLDGCSVGEVGDELVAFALSGNPLLKKLTIQRIGTGFQSMQLFASALRNHSSLQVLNARDNDIDDTSFEMLAPALLTHPTLEELDLSRNHISLPAAVANIISNNSVLQKLSLLDNAIEIENVKSIAVALQSNSTLKVVALTSQRTAEFVESEMGALLEIMGIELEILKENSQLEYLTLADGEYQDSLSDMKQKMIHQCNFNRGGRKILQDRSFSLSLWPLVLERADTIAYYQAYDDATVKATNEDYQASILFSLLREASTQLFSQCHRTTGPAPVLTMMTGRR